MPKITILFCIDNNYAVQTATSISSIIRSNPNQSFNVNIAFFGRDVQKTDMIFKGFCVFPNLSLTIIDLEETLFYSLPTTKQFSKSIYARLVFDKFVDEGIDRILYLDADTIIRGDLRPLWETNLNGAVLGAVRDFFRANPTEIGFVEDQPYFNSGMLLIDRKLWRQRNCEVKVLDLLTKSGQLMSWMDQDALNIVLNGQVKFVGLEYNFQPRCADVKASFLYLSEQTYRSLRKNPVIVHYTTSFKPWNAAFRVHYSNWYFDAQASSELIGEHLLPMPTVQSVADWVIATKTKLRWHFPRVFGWARSVLNPTAAARMYRAGPEL